MIKLLTTGGGIVVNGYQYRSKVQIVEALLTLFYRRTTAALWEAQMLSWVSLVDLTVSIWYRNVQTKIFDQFEASAPVLYREASSGVED